MPLGLQGSLPRLFKEASKIAQAQHATVLRHLDTISTLDDPSEGASTGGTLSRADHLTLLASNEEYQSEQLARMPWMSKSEREQLRRDLMASMRLHPEQAPPGLPPESPLTAPPPELVR